MQQPGRIVGHDLEDSEFARMFVVEMDDGRPALAAAVQRAPDPPAQERRYVDRAGDHPLEHPADVRGGGGVLPEKTLFVRELEHVEHQTVRRCHGLAAVDVHPEGRQHT
jgi:hypothetical protein